MNAMQTPELKRGPDVRLRMGKDHFSVKPATLNAWLDEGSVFLVDVREPHEFERDRIAGAFLVSMSRFDPDTFPRISGLKTVLVSEQGPRSSALTERLADAGFADVFSLDGGLAAWREAGLELDD